MKRIFAFLLCFCIFACGCSQSGNTDISEKESINIMEIGDNITVTGVVGYSDKPSDIGQEYCFITTDKKTEYKYKDIYGGTSEWSSNVFYTKGDDTEYLKEYIGKNVTVSGIFDAESHGIPYITSIEVE